MPESLLTLSGPSLPGLPEPDMRRSLMSGLTLITEPASSPESLAWGPMLGDAHCWGMVTPSDVPHVWSVDVSPHSRRISEKLIRAPCALLSAWMSLAGWCTVYCVQCRAQPVLCCTVQCHLPRLAWAVASTTAEKIATDLWRYLLLCYRQKPSKLVFSVDKI